MTPYGSTKVVGGSSSGAAAGSATTVRYSDSSCQTVTDSKTVSLTNVCKKAVFGTGSSLAFISDNYHGEATLAANATLTSK